jgi:hypothetical protein
MSGLALIYTAIRKLSDDASRGAVTTIDHPRETPVFNWDTTPWAEINEMVRLTLSRRDYAEWLKRPDVQERKARE